MIEIDGPMWFVAALFICGWHVIHLRGWRRERKTDLAWWQTYDTRAQARHEEFMRAMKRDDAHNWDLNDSPRGQA